ncbi:MAG TPA: hypothetical protein VGB11_06305 [Candidatus Bathyarchaeia archaeon]
MESPIDKYLLFVVVFASTTSSTSLIPALAVSATLVIADIALFYLSKATFRREEILTKWK